ncbi:hypothetical protein ACFYXC_21390 [Streptomyces sp. NPDC002701]|uniref:hypothetical protein n=1 Tax=Streptomyces sp. NPDC002701 TaxID=3364661 RepID=UPI00367BB1B6
MQPSRTVSHRAALGLVGLVLLAGGTWLAVTPASWATGLPTWWPDPGPHTALVDRDGLAELRTTRWWTPSVVAGSIAATTLFALCCVRQLRGGARPSIPLPVPGSTLRTRALEDAATRQAVAIDGVVRCRTRVLPRHRHLNVTLHVWLRPDATPAAVLPALADLAGRTETALSPYDVRTRVRFSARTHRGSHVR